MEKNEIMALAGQIKTVEDLKKNENRLVDAVKQFVSREIGPTHERPEDVQNLINKCINSFAATLRDEIGLMDTDSAKLLERVRLMSERTKPRKK